MRQVTIIPFPRELRAFAADSALTRRRVRACYEMCANQFRAPSVYLPLIFALPLFVVIFVIRWQAGPQLATHDRSLSLKERRTFNYSIQEDDQLRLIANRYYGNQNFIPLLLANPHLLPVDKRQLLNDPRGNYPAIEDELKKMKIHGIPIKIEVR